MTGDDSSKVSDADVRAMVSALRPEWRVTAVERVSEGTDFVAVLDIDGADTDHAVLKANSSVHPCESTPSVSTAADTFRAEPYLLELAECRTSIPVPSVFGYCDHHNDLPAPFYLMEYAGGVLGDDDAVDTADARETMIRAAGRHLAELHEVGTLPATGFFGVKDGELVVLDTETHQRYEDFRDWLLAEFEYALDALEEGGFFPEYADVDDPRFADLVGPLREYARDAIPALPDGAVPTYSHCDYRYGNIRVDPDTGETVAVLDWHLWATPPEYNIASAESHLITPDDDPQRRTVELRDLFRTTYAESRGEWEFDEATRERIRLSRLKCRVGAMACLPMWFRNEPLERRNERAAEHRAFVQDFLND